MDVEAVGSSSAGAAACRRASAPKTAICIPALRPVLGASFPRGGRGGTTHGIWPAPCLYPSLYHLAIFTTRPFRGTPHNFDKPGHRQTDAELPWVRAEDEDAPRTIFTSGTLNPFMHAVSQVIQTGLGGPAPVFPHHLLG